MHALKRGGGIATIYLVENLSGVTQNLHQRIMNIRIAGDYSGSIYGIFLWI